MAQALENGNAQAIRQFIREGVWSDAEVIETHQAHVGQTLGRPDGVSTLDGCDFPKQGEDSVGVARQYCGLLGKVANCQASVMLAYASSAGPTLLDRRRFLPQSWFEDANQKHWKKCGVPAGTPYRTSRPWERRWSST
jgi:SRSO17 transposase